MNNQIMLFQTLADTIPGWDSQAIISLVCELEKRFGVEFDILEIADIRKVKIIKDLLKDKGVIF